MSKLITTDNLAKLSAGLDARYKSLINDSVSDMVGNSVDAAQATILVEVKKQVDEVKDMLGGKSLVYLTQAEYDALSEEEKNDENIVYNITDSESADHEHENLEFLDKITAINITIGNKTQVLDFNGNLNFSLEDIGVDNNHKHDEYYTEEEINNVVSNLEALISGKSDTGHNHDDRYYTTTKIGELLSDKASKDHSHDEFDTFAIKSEMNSALEGKANKQHEHDEYATKLGLEEDLEIIEGSINEVSQNVTALDTTLRGLINNKADSEHSHDDKYYMRSEVDENISEAITNQNSELTAEINRVESMLGGKSIVYITQAEYDALSESEKTNELKTYFITDADDSHNHDDLYYTEDEVNTLLAGKSDLGHDHDDRYYTETEINTKLADKADKIHEHSDLATVDSLNNAVSTINAAIAKKSDDTHNHDGDYYNKTEATTKFSDIEGDITSLGQEITALNTSISSAETRAKNYADQQITALVNSAPEAMNTLGELAKAISDHSTEYEAYVATVSTSIATAKAEAIADAAAKDTALHTTISAEIDGKIEDINEDINNQVTEIVASLEYLDDAKLNASDALTHFIQSILEQEGESYDSHTLVKGEKIISPFVNTNTVLADDGTTLTYYLNYFDTAIGNLSSSIGNGNDLLTDTKDNVVSCINELQTEINNLDNELDTKVKDINESISGNVSTLEGKIATAKAEAIAEAAAKDTALRTTISAEIDADVKAEKDRAMDAEEVLQNAINGKANASHGAHVEFDDTTAPKANGTASVGSSTKVARADHVHPIPDSVSSAGEANQVKNPLTIRLNSGTTEGTNQFVFNGSSAKTVNITPDSIGASVSGHNHNDLYYTEAEIDAKLEDVDANIAGITIDKIGAAPANHNHDYINTRGNVACETANNAPAVEGLSMSHAYNNGYPTNYGNVMTMSGAGDGQLLIGWSGTSGAHAPVFVRSKRDTPDSNWSEWAQIYTTANKPTPEEIGAQRVNNTVETVSVVNGVLQLTSNPRQKCTNMVSGTQINFPTVSNAEFLEVHLYFNAESDISLALPDNCKWRVDPNLDAGTSYELVATWNTMNWLVNLMVYS